MSKRKTMAEELTACTAVDTTPFEGQKPGTSGLRKKTKVFVQERYIPNFVQSTFNALEGANVPVKGGTLVISGDGRYYNKVAIQQIIKIAVANGVDRIWCGKDGLLSTPGVSAVIRNRGNGFEPFGAFILTASHNPGGIDEDFGIKYNCENGGPAPESVTDAIFEHTKKISQISIAKDFPDIDLSKIAVTTVGAADTREVKVEIFDSTEDQVDVLSKCFDFPSLKNFITRKDVTILYDSMNGVNGPYARKVFVDILGGSEHMLQNCTPLEDFGGKASPSHGHADPNLKNAVELCAKMCVSRTGTPLPGADTAPTLGAGADGDGDRNMILGPGFFVTPSDSLAVIVDQCVDCIPQFREGIRSAARSMPTSAAVDLVCKSKGIKCYETPTGWKYFGNLMDANECVPLICGEESFGTGSDHLREKDGMWAVLAWLSILAAKNPDPSKPLVGIADIVKQHWAKYGRNYYARHDYEGVESQSADNVMAGMIAKMGKWNAEEFGAYKLEKADVFEYLDPIDGSIAKNQGIRFCLEGNSRIVFRLSGTGVDGATIRIYLERFEGPGGDLDLNSMSAVEPLAKLASSLSNIHDLTGRAEPSVIT